MSTGRAGALLGALCLSVALGASCFFIEPFDDPVPDPLTGSSSGEVLCTPQQALACYPGPPSTRDVGPCAAGVQTCNDDGKSFGPCIGAVLPSYEDCSSSDDEDCDGRACEGTVTLAKSFGDSNQQVGVAVAAGADGAVVLGSALGSIDFGQGPLADLGGPTVDIVLARFDTAGEPVWQKRFPDATGTSVAFADNGDVLMTGSAFGSIDFGGGPLDGTDPLTPDVFVARFNAKGEHVSSVRFASEGAQHAKVIAGTPVGVTLIGGSFEGTFDFGFGTLTSTDGLDAFLMLLDGNGKPISAKSFGGPGDQEISSIVFDVAQGIIFGGTFEGQINLGGLTLASAGGKDIFVGEIDKTGNHIWSRSFGGMSNESLAGIAVDPLSSVWIAGAFGGTVVIDQTTLATSSEDDIMLVKLDTGGALIKAFQYGAPGSPQKAAGIAVDPGGNVLLAGAFAGALDFDDYKLMSAGGADLFVAKLNSSAVALWALGAGDGATQTATAIASDPLGGAWVTGFFSGSMPIGGFMLTANGSGADMFVLHVGP